MYVYYIPAYSIYTPPKPTQPPLQAPPEPSGAIAIGITPEVWASKRDSRLRQYSRGHAHRMPRGRQEENYIQESEPTYEPCKFSMSNKAQTNLSCDFDQSYSSTLKSTTAVWPGRNQQDMIPAHLIGQSYPICTRFLTATGRLLYHELSP